MKRIELQISVGVTTYYENDDKKENKRLFVKNSFKVKNSSIPSNIV